MTFLSTVSTRVRTSATLAGAIFAALLAASCNTTQNAPSKVDADSSVYAAPLNASALSAHACGAPIIAYRNLIDRDVRTGFLNQSVYNRIAPQIASAASTCMAGNNSAAIASLNTTKRLFGYPTL